MKKLLIAHCAICLLVLLLALLFGSGFFSSLFAERPAENTATVDTEDVASEQDNLTCGGGGCGAGLPPELYNTDSPLPPILP